MRDAVVAIKAHRRQATHLAAIELIRSWGRRSSGNAAVLAQLDARASASLAPREQARP